MPEQQLLPEQRSVLRVRKKWGGQILQAHLYSVDTLKLNIPQALLASIVICESGGWKGAVRFEQAVFNRFRKNTPGLEGVNLLKASSSHGACQIMGYHSKELYDWTKKSGKGFGWLPYTIDELYEKPCEACAVFLQYNAGDYVKNAKWEAVARIYNGGSPTANNKITNEYQDKIQRYMKLFEWSIKEFPTEDKIPDV